jgi:hypothetical protein
MTKQTLKGAVYLAVSGQSKGLQRAAAYLHGKPEGGWPETMQARHNIEEDLPGHWARAYTVQQFIDALYYIETWSGGAGLYRSRTAEDAYAQVAQ